MSTTTASASAPAADEPMAPAAPSSSSSGSVPDYLQSLSPAQLAAATHPATGALSISAPPGSGKTRVLTSRVAWLVREQKIMPEELVVVTFTNKASNEMKLRLSKLIGDDRTSRLVLGTFHATCVRYLRKYARLIGIDNSFSVTDADDSKKIIKDILKPLKEELEAQNLKVKPDNALSTISWSKAKGVSPAQYRADIHKKDNNKGYRGEYDGLVPYKNAIAHVYEEYEKHLRESNALDFDDLLVMGAKLLKEHPSVVSNIRHTLVDEMQDTNTTQYQLMSGFSSATRCVTTVGDPDQAVYGWRAAEVGNLDKMKQEYKCEQFLLEENYRSTGKILEAALAVIEQDKKRVAKGLFTSHPSGPPASLRINPSPQEEASFVATEIKRLVAYSGGMFDWNDFAILLRYNALSREVEQALQAENIPSRMLGGHKFFDRVEIKDILAYLTLAVNPTYTPAFVRVVNVPKRGIGDKSVEEFLKLAAKKNMTPMALAEQIVDGEDAPKAKKGAKGKGKAKASSDVKPGMKKGLGQLVGAVRELRKQEARGKDVAQLIKMIYDNIDYKKHLETLDKKQSDNVDTRIANIDELKNFSKIVAENAGDVRDLADVGRVFAENLDLRRELGEDGGGIDGGQTSLNEQPVSDSEEGPAIEAMDEVRPAAVEKAESSSSTVKTEQGTGEMVKKEKPKRSAKKEKEEPASSPPAKRKLPSRNRSSRSKSAITIDDSADDEDEDDAGPSSSARPQRKRAKKAATPDYNEQADEDDDDAGPSSSARPQRKRAKKAATPDYNEQADDGSDSEPDLTTQLPMGNPLRTFLEACTLSTDQESKEEGKNGPKVTISTCHAAKGLEYPVVFVMGVEDGIVPFYKSTKPEELDEERRLLYVAMTRAQALLCLSHCRKRMYAGQMEYKNLSPFITPIVDSSRQGNWTASSGATKIDFEEGRPTIDAAALEVFGKVLQRTVPDAKVVDEKVKAWEQTPAAAKAAALDAMGGAGGYSDSDEYYSESDDDIFSNYERWEQKKIRREAKFGAFRGGFGGGRGRGGGFGFGFGRGGGASSSMYGAGSSSRAFTSAASSSSTALPKQEPGSDVKPQQLHTGFTSALNSLEAKDKMRFNTVTSAGGSARTPTNTITQPSTAVAPGPRFIEDYKRGGAGHHDGAALAAAEGVAAGAGTSRDSLMATFQSSHQGSLDALKGMLGGEGSSSFDAGSGSNGGGGASVAPRKPGKSLGMGRRTPSIKSSSSSSSPRPGSAQK